MKNSDDYKVLGHIESIKKSLLEPMIELIQAQYRIIYYQKARQYTSLAIETSVLLEKSYLVFQCRIFIKFTMYDVKGGITKEITGDSYLCTRKIKVALNQEKSVAELSDCWYFERLLNMISYYSYDRLNCFF